MSKEKIGMKPNWDDAVYRKKFISTHLAELIGGTKRGAKINLWEKAKRDDIESEERLPYIYTVTTDLKWNKIDEVHFMDFENGKHEYDNLKTVKDIYDLIWRNR